MVYGMALTLKQMGHGDAALKYVHAMQMLRRQEMEANTPDKAKVKDYDAKIEAKMTEFNKAMAKANREANR
jgi:hypothetical protein